jgi:Zn finger protein HypA/HybF involved in hydrogenase expression
MGLALVLGALVTVAIWGTGDAEWYGRTVGVVAVLLAAFTLLVPVLHRASRAELARLAAERAAGVRFCPCCGAALEAAPGAPTTCPRCGARFTVVLEQPVE